MPATERSAPIAIGVDLGGTKIEVIALGPNGHTLARERVATPAGDYRAILAALAMLVDGIEARLGQQAPHVGVGIPGTATGDGLVKNANSVCLIGQPLEADLRALLGRPVRLANDANCLALSEATDGAGAGASVVFAAILGTGVGAGVVVNGQVLSGANGLAGEWGHNPLPWLTSDEATNDAPGRVCYCGKRGCNETWLSGPGLAADHQRHTGAVLPAEQIAARAAAGDAACEATLQRHESRLARALAQVINLLDPQVIVLGGGLSNLDRLYEHVPRLWGQFVFGASDKEPVRTRLLKSRHGDSSGVRGAAWLWAGPTSQS